jgi:hypothetical protein
MACHHGLLRTSIGADAVLCMQWQDLMTQLSNKYPDATARVICDFLNEPDFGNLRWEAQPDAGLPGMKDMYLNVMDLVYPVASSKLANCSAAAKRRALKN